jgi:hypothetical protein
MCAALPLHPRQEGSHSNCQLCCSVVLCCAVPAGDVIGLTNPGAFAIGDTIYAGTGTDMLDEPTATATVDDLHQQ